MKASAPGGTGSGPIRDYRTLPGPPAMPLLGSALLIDKERLHLQFEAWARRYGPCYRMRLGSRRLLVLSDHQLIGSVLRDRPGSFRRPTRHGDIIREIGFATGLFFVNDEEWRRQRRLVMAALDPAHVHAYFPALQKVVQRLRGRWLQAATEGRLIDVQADLMRYTVDVVAGLAFGSDVNTLERDDPIQAHLNRVFPAMARRLTAPLPYWRWIKTRADRELEQSVVVIRSAIDGFIRAARAELARDPARRLAPTNLLEAMLVAAAAEAGISDADVAGNVLVMLVAGEDTTANTISWLIHFLFENPHALTAARDEVRRVCAEDPSLSLDALGRLVYLEACLHETMRLKPVAPVQTAQATRDVVVGDVAVPAGAIVVGLVRPDATSARHFADPQRFEPTRWLAADERTRASPARVSMPFGAGPRLCPGRYLAVLEMKVAAAMLLDSFELDWVGTPHSGPPEELFAFAMAPRELAMRLRPL